MTDALLLTILVVGAALAFDFVNGFHDASNSIATIVATEVLKPLYAVCWAAFFNFIALFLALSFFGVGVAKTVGNGMINLDLVTPVVILSGLIGAVTWGLITWWMRIPTSSSHALIGGYAGAAIFNSAITKGLDSMYDPIIVAGWSKTLMFIVIAPLIGLTLGNVLMRITMLIEQKISPERTDKYFGRMQLLSSAGLSLMHGSNDAQKTAGIIAGALVAGGFYETFTIPDWVLWVSFGTMALGTLVGGWRIVRTLGRDLTRLRPNGGFSAETAAAVSILTATLLHMPVSTTHATTGAVIGTGAARSFRSVRWNLAGNILWAWVFTIPAAAAIGGIAMGIAILIYG